MFYDAAVSGQDTFCKTLKTWNFQPRTLSISTKAIGHTVLDRPSLHFYLLGIFPQEASIGVSPRQKTVYPHRGGEVVDPEARVGLPHPVGGLHRWQSKPG